ncbi:MAG: chalcone isomerase family protein [Paucibacter sp.]|nr:chalcone isomerase family protein [Roseateles sp.]
MRRFLIAVVTTLAVLGAQAQTEKPVEVAGVKFETVETVGGQKLQLNGAGIRYKAIFKVYAAGLYLSAKTNTVEGVLAATGPKRLHIVALRDIDGNDLGKMFTKGIESNASRDEFIKSINGVLKISEMFATRKELKKGESFTVDFIPGTGTFVSVNGTVQGDPIKEPEFYGAFLHIWLGKNPPDAQLKDKLAGISPQRSNN